MYVEGFGSVSSRAEDENDWVSVSSFCVLDEKVCHYGRGFCERDWSGLRVFFVREIAGGV